MDFAGMTVDEIKAIATEARDALKARKAVDGEADKASREALKAEVDASGREKVETLDEGDRIVILFKDTETEATFVKVTDKRFTVEIEGEKRSVRFDKFIDTVGEAVEIEDEDETVEADAEAV